MRKIENEDEPLTVQQAQFVQEYLIDLNGTQAAIRAGYSPNNANSYASELLAQPNIAKRVAVALAQRTTRTHVTQDQVLTEMSLLANSRLDWFEVDDNGNVVPAAHAPEGAMAAVASVKRKERIITDKLGNPQFHPDGRLCKAYDVEIKLWDKPTPLKLMGRHVGLFPDKVEVTGPNGGPIETVSRVERVVVDPNPSNS